MVFTLTESDENFYISNNKISDILNLLRGMVMVKSGGAGKQRAQTIPKGCGERHHCRM